MLLLEGGVGGHMSHLYDNPTLTFKQMKEVLIAAASGELIGTEKTDGQNLFVSYSIPEGRAKAARNGGHVKQGGLTPEEIAKFFGGRGDLEKTFSESFKAFEEAVEDLSDEEKEQIFGPDTNVYYSAEVIDPRSTNVINYYDTKTLAIHRAAAAEFDKETGDATDRDVSQNVDFLARALEAKQDELQTMDYKVEMDAIQELAGLKDGTILKNTLARLEAVISDEGISDNQTVLEYMIARIMTLIVENGIDLEPEIEAKVVKRILFSNKGYQKAAGYDKLPPELNLNALMKTVGGKKSLEGGFLRSIIEKDVATEYLKQAIWPVEDVIHDFSVEMLRDLESLFVLDNGENVSHKEVQRLRAETAEAIDAIENSGNDEAMAILQVQMAKLKDVENVSTAAEGFVFDFDGHTYKFTGSFAPMNQLLGLFKYGRGNVPPLKKQIDKVLQVPRASSLASKGRMKLREAELIQEVMDILLTELSISGDGDIGGFSVPAAARTIALFPGAFRPPTKGHLATARTLMDQADRAIILISNPKSESSKRRIGDREITPEMTKEIWELYGMRPEDVQISAAASPVRALFDFIDDPKLSPPGTKIMLGCSDKGGDEARFEGAAAYARKTRGDEVEVVAGTCPTKQHEKDYDKLLKALENIELPSVKKGKDPMNIHGSDMRHLAALALEGNEELEKLFKHFIPSSVDHKEVLRILSGDLEENVSGMIFEMIEEILNEKYVSRDCKKKNGETGHCAMISHKTHKQKACYDDCDTARAATHLEEDEEDPGAERDGDGAPGEPLEEDWEEEKFGRFLTPASANLALGRGDVKIPADMAAAKNRPKKKSKKKAPTRSQQIGRTGWSLTVEEEEEELGEIRAASHELPSRKKEKVTPGHLKAASDARMRASFQKAVDKQKEKNRLSAKFNKNQFNKKNLEEDELDETSSGAGGSVSGYSLPLGEKPTYFHDEAPRLKETMPGIKLIYKRREKSN